MNSTNCWLWQGCTDHKGYGQVEWRGRRFVAHRLSYEIQVGPIPPGLTLDHLCRNRGCVNPSHLEPVTIRENILRGFSPCAKNTRKAACPRGHPYDMLMSPRPNGRGGLRHVERRCRECYREATRRFRARARQGELMREDDQDETYPLSRGD